MVKTKLPVQVKTDDGNGKITTTARDIDVAVDTSIFAEQRWEANFPAQAAHETLFTYIERVQTDKLIDKAHILSNLKAIFCFIESDEIADFKSFCQLFDLADGEYLKRLTDKIEYIFNLVLNSSVATSKNF